MDDRTHAYIAQMGNPYAILSILDEAELDALDSWPAPSSPQPVAATPMLKRAPLVQSYFVPILDQPPGNPYAQLSDSGDDEADPLLGKEKPPVVIPSPWKLRSDIYHFVGEAFAIPFVRRRPPALLRQFAGTVLRLSARAQIELRARIQAYLPEKQVAYNRLSPRELDALLERLVELADNASSLDGKTD
jgi:hypothetical protein